MARKFLRGVEVDTLKVTGGATNNYYLKSDASGNATWSALPSTLVVGPASATDNAIVRFDSTTGALVQNSTVTVGDTNIILGSGSNGVKLSSGFGSNGTTISGGTGTGYLLVQDDQVSIAGSTLSMGSNQINNVTDPTSPQDAATKAYVDANAGGFSYTEVTGTSQTAAINSGYIASNASLVTVTLPTTAAKGSVIEVVGKGAGGWKIAQVSGQTTHFLSSDTTTGTGGSLASTTQYDSVKLLCVTANSSWVVINAMGNITVV